MHFYALYYYHYTAVVTPLPGSLSFSLSSVKPMVQCAIRDAVEIENRSFAVPIFPLLRLPQRQTNPGT